MTVIVIPYLGCNLHCAYCFAHGYKWVENPKMDYNLQAILSSMERIHKKTGGDGFCMHGGECTLIPRHDFETILKKMYTLQNRSALQTNGYTIDHDMIRLFKKYKTSPGVSIDGPPELNILRGFPDNLEKNRKYTKTVLENMFKMQEQGIYVGVIILLHKANTSSPSKLKKLLDFILMLRDHNIKGGRLNFMWTNFQEVKQYELTPEQASEAYLYLYKHLKPYSDLRWNPFREFTDNLLGYSQSSCTYGKCDYFCTTGAKAILPDGSLGNCDRTHQSGYAYTRATEEPTYERYEVLKETDCDGCRYYDVCYGGCPSAGQDEDWRNKTRWCKAIHDLYTIIERDLKAMLPNIILVPDHPEVDYFDLLKKGKHLTPFRKMNWEKNRRPSSWKKDIRPLQKQSSFKESKGNVPHGDVPHGDHTDHGDSTK